MPKLARAGGSLYYEKKGKGEPIVILRGLGRSCRYWLGFDRLLAKHCQVITLDHRGLGRSDADLSWFFGMDQMVDDLLCLLDHLKLKRVHLFGLSLGGMVAMAFAKRHQDRCQTLMIANSSTADRPSWRISPLALKDLLLRSPTEGFHKVLLELVTSPEIVAAQGHKIYEAWEKILAQEGFPWLIILKQVLAVSRFRIAGGLNGQLMPTLVISGSQDRLVPPRNSRLIHRLIPGSRWLSMDVGHEISIGREKLLLKHICEFIGEAHK